MSVIQNKWIQKERKKRAPVTASAYQADDYDILDSGKNPDSRYSVAARATYVRTLRGVRK
jgi:hypothetical protein